MASHSPVDVLIQFIVQTEWERVGESGEALLASASRALCEFVNIRDYQRESEEPYSFNRNGEDDNSDINSPFYSYYAFDRKKEKLIHKIRDARVRSLFSTYHFANETVGVEGDGGQFISWDTLLYTFIIYSTSVLLWDGTVEGYEDHLRALYHLPAPSASPLRERARMASAVYGGVDEMEDEEEGEEEGIEKESDLPEGAQVLRDAMRTFLPLFPSVHLLERQPALLAALGNLASCVWSAQERCHGGAGRAATEVVCPLCYAAALDHVLAAEALLSLLDYHYVVRYYTANSHLQQQQLLPPPARRRASSSHALPPQVHLGVARRRCSMARGGPSLSAEALLQDATTAASHWWTAAETRADAQAKRTVWRHVLAVGRVCCINGSVRVLQRLLHAWVFSTAYHQELFTCAQGEAPAEGAVATPSVVLRVTQDTAVTPARLVHLLLSLYVQDEAALRQLSPTSGSAGDRSAVRVAAVQRSAEDTYYSLYTLQRSFEPMCTTTGGAKGLHATTFLLPSAQHEAQEALRYHLAHTVYPALATALHPQGTTVLAWLASLPHAPALRLLLPTAPDERQRQRAAATAVDAQIAAAAAPPERDAVEHIVFVPAQSARVAHVPAALPSTCPGFSPAATRALAEAVRAGDLAVVRLLLLSGASRYALPLSVLLAALPHAGERAAGDPSVALWHLLHRPLQLEAPARGREVAERLQAGRCATAAADLLAALAARLWREKVQYVDGDAAAHDRVLRPCLAALGYDPLHPQARVTLLLVLQAKLLGWLRPLGADPRAALTAPLPYVQLVLRLYQQLTTEEALRSLYAAIEVQCTLDAVFTLREARQREDARDGGEDEAPEPPTTVVSAWLVPDYAVIERAKKEADALLDGLIERVSAQLQRAPAAVPPAPRDTLADAQAPDAPLYLLVSLASLLRHTAAAAGPAPSRWYHCRHRRRRDLLAALALPHLHHTAGVGAAVGAVVWARVAPTADVEATLREHGGVYAVLDHDVPPASPAQLGDLYLIVRGAGAGGETVWECVDVLSFYSTALHCHLRTADDAAAAVATEGTARWAPLPPVETVDLKVSLVCRPPAAQVHLRCVLHSPPPPASPHPAPSPLSWLTAQPSPACRQRCAAADCLTALLSCRDTEGAEARQVLQLQRAWKDVWCRGKQPLWLRRVPAASLSAFDLPSTGEKDVYVVDVPLRCSTRSAAPDSGRQEEKDCCAALADQESLFVFASECGDAREPQKPLSLHTLPPDGL